MLACASDAEGHVDALARIYTARRLVPAAVDDRRHAISTGALASAGGGDVRPTAASGGYRKCERASACQPQPEQQRQQHEAIGEAGGQRPCIGSDEPQRSLPSPLLRPRPPDRQPRLHRQREALREGPAAAVGSAGNGASPRLKGAVLSAEETQTRQAARENGAGGGIKKARAQRTHARTYFFGELWALSALCCAFLLK